MLTNRKIEERQARKQRILQGALEVFREKGVEGATMDEIAQMAGFGKSTLYYYFPSKEDVFTAIMVDGWEHLWLSIEDIIHADYPPKETFLKILKALAEIVDHNRARYEFLFNAAKMLSQHTNEPAWRPFQQRLYATLLAILKDGVAAGEFADIQPELMLQAIGGIFHQMVFTRRDRSEVTEAEIEDVVTRLLLKFTETTPH
ncbi:MAG: TetR/AcrR family transcriptional regulator [Candidatus Neomarinimicrobiota bacterium]